MHGAEVLSRAADGNACILLQSERGTALYTTCAQMTAAALLSRKRTQLKRTQRERELFGKWFRPGVTAVDALQEDRMSAIDGILKTDDGSTCNMCLLVIIPTRRPMRVMSI